MTEKEIERWGGLQVSLMHILSTVTSPLDVPDYIMQSSIQEHIQAVYDTKDFIEDYHNRLIEEIEREVIGEDEKRDEGTFKPYNNSITLNIKNKLRAEQRKKLAEYKV